MTLVILEFERERAECEGAFFEQVKLEKRKSVDTLFASEQDNLTVSVFNYLNFFNLFIAVL